MGGAAWLSIFGLGKASTRKHIRSDLRPRSNAIKGKKRRHPQGKSTSRRLAALLAPYRPMWVCASLAPCQPPRIALARSPPIYEMASNQLNQDAEHLRLLSIFHYIVAGVRAFVSFFRFFTVPWEPCFCLPGGATGQTW
jgi:hypothetical protein